MSKTGNQLFRDWRFWVVITAAVAAIAFWLVFQADLTCSSPRKRQQMEIFKANSCFEFWLNRYQSLAAAVVATIVAFIVVRPVFDQLTAMKAQSAFGAKQVAEDFAKAIDNEIAALIHIDNDFWYAETYLSDFIKPPDRLGISKGDAEETIKLIESIDKALPTVRAADRQQLANTTINTARRELLAAADEHRRKCNDIARRIISWSSQKVDEERQMKRDEALTYRLMEADKTYDDFKSKSEYLRKALESLSRQKWSDVRRFEREAQGIVD